MEHKLQRRDFLKMSAFAVVSGVLAACVPATSTSTTGTTGITTSAASAPSSTGAVAATATPTTGYSEATVAVTTSTGTKQVTYGLYKHLPYVTKPVDADFQSLDIKVPLKVDGKAVDAKSAPILFKNSVGGYVSASNVNSGQIGGPGGTPPASMKGAPPAGAMGGGPDGNSSGVSSNTDLALAAGYVVVEPGCRGRDNQAKDGTYYGKAPAAIVDLKAAVRYLRHNKGTLPGNTDWIISTGVSAGGAPTRYTAPAARRRFTTRSPQTDPQRPLHTP